MENKHPGVEQFFKFLKGYLHHVQLTTTLLNYETLLGTVHGRCPNIHCIVGSEVGAKRCTAETILYTIFNECISEGSNSLPFSHSVAEIQISFCL